MYEQITAHMKTLGYKEHWIGYTLGWVYELHQNGVHCLGRFIRKLLATRDKISCSNIITEGRFAIILARNNFSDIQLEYTEKGPDIKAAWNRDTVYFEVTRRLPDVDEWADGFDINKLSRDRTENIISKIEGKLRQLQSGEVNIVVIWSDTVRLSLPDVAEAFKYIQQEIYHNPGIYKDLSGVLLTEGGGVSSSTLKQFYLFRNDKASKPLGTRLAQKLESLHEKDPKKLQKEFEAIAKALRQYRNKGDR